MRKRLLLRLAYDTEVKLTFLSLKITEAIPRFVAIALNQGRSAAMRACRQWLLGE